MYVRINADKSGRLYLEQLLTLSDVKNGVTRPAEPRWERVPTVGIKGMETYNLPIGQSCGILILKKLESYFDLGHGHVEKEVIFAVSALDIFKIQEEGHHTKFFTRDKESFIVKMPQVQFIEMVLELLTGFKVLKFDIKGNLIQGE